MKPHRALFRTISIFGLNWLRQSKCQAPTSLSPIKINEALYPIRTDVTTSDTRNRAKPRAEVTQSLFDGQSGRLDLGFHFDNVTHKTQRNNEAPPMSIKIRTPEGLEFDTANKSFPEIATPEYDTNPREMLIDVSKSPGGQPLKMDIFHFTYDQDQNFYGYAARKHIAYPEFNADGGSSAFSNQV